MSAETGSGIPRLLPTKAIETSLRSQNGVFVGAWCETEIPTAAAPMVGEMSPNDIDAKPQTRKILAELGVPTQYLKGDEQASRRMWDGLQNVHQGGSPQDGKSRYWLPGITLNRDERPQAVIRINIDDEEVPQPVSTSRVFKAKHRDPSEQETATTLYQVTTDLGSPVWIFCNVPRAYDGGDARRLGGKYTRWDAKRSVSSEKKEERRKGEMPETWYSMTASEIYPLACAEGVSEEALAIVTAKLCHRAQFWDGRSRFPVPLHAAKQMDLDHPQYRRTVTPEEKPTEEPGADTPQSSPVE